MKDNNTVQMKYMVGKIDEKPPLIKPGTYELSFEAFQTAVMFARAQKLIMQFRVITLGEYFGVTLYRYYNVQGFCGKPGKNGRFKVGWKSDFAREYASLFGELPKRADRFPMTPFSENIIRGRVATVKVGSRQRKLAKPCHYSVINELLEVKKI